MGNLVKTVSIEVRGLIADASAKIGTIARGMQGLADKSPVELAAKLEGSEAIKAKFAEIDANAERLKRDFPEFAAKLDITAASAKLAVLRAEARRTGSEVQALSGDMQALSSRAGGLGRSLDNALPGFAGLIAAGAALGPALLPVLASVTGGVIGMGAALAGAGAGAGIFALAAAGNLAELQKQLTKVQAANLAANTALQTAAKNRTKAQDQAIVKARMLTAAFNKEFGAEADAIEKLKSSWISFTTQPVVTGAIAAGARLLTAVLPHLTPLLKLGASAAQAFIGALSGFTVGGGLDKLVSTLVRLGKIGLAGLLAVLHNLAVAFGALSGGASEFAQGAVSGLARLTKAFADWAQNKGSGALTGLMTTIRQLGPGVVSLIRNLAAAVPNLAKGLFPLAPLSLALATALSGIIANVPPGVITAIAVAFVAWTAAAKGLMAAGALGGAWKAVVKFSAAAEGATVAQTIAAAATRAWGLAMDALPWVALAAAVVTVAVLIIKYHKQIWAFVQRVWDDILGVIQGVWGWVKRNWPLLLGIITGPIGLAAVFIVKHFTLVKDFIHWAWDQIQIFSLRAVKGVLDAFSHIPLIGGMFHRAASAIGGELTRIQKDSATTWARIQAGMDRVHGKKVALIFSLDLPPGVTYPSRHIKGHAAGGMATPGEMAWVGEQGPELVHFRGPATVFSNRRSRQIAGYAGGTLDSFSASFPSARGLAAAFQGAVSAIAREVRNLIGVVKVVVPGGAGVQRWAPLVLQVLRMLGQPSADIGVALRQMQTESGGNPTVVNRTDSNWLAGHPSVGLMQVIAGTFASYAGRYRNTGPFEYGVSVNPLANIFAGLNYAVHRYGAGWTRVLGQGHGYDSGGWLMPGWNPPMYNGTGRPEHLIPAARRAGQAASAQVVIRVGGTGSGTLNRALLTWLREAIHVEGGGDVQIALGS